MKILHIINNLGSGGAEKLIEEMVPILNNKDNIKIDILLLTDKNNVFEKKLKKNGIKIDVVPLRKKNNPINIYYIRKHIIKGNYDIVHAHLFPTIYWTAIVSKLIFKKQVKFVMTEHSTHNTRREKNYLRYFEKFIYSSYDKVISISKQVQENLISWLRPNKYELKRFVVITNGINVNKYGKAIPYKKSDICKEFTEETKLVCMVGRFTKAKDQSTLIKAMRDLPKNVHLLLVGQGPLIGECKDLAKSFSVSDRVHFLGFRNDIDRILKTVDIVVLSSNWEGFGLAAVEGMAAGKPVIVSDIDGLREVVEGAGITFPKGNSDKLAEILNILINNMEIYNEISKLCLQRSKLFDMSNTIEAYFQLYRDLFKKTFSDD